MTPSAFDNETAVLGPPEGMSEDEVFSLSVAFLNYEGAPAVLSCWKPTKQELEEIQRTGRVWLVLMGPSMQPAIVSGNDPLEWDNVKLAAPRLDGGGA